MTEWKNPRTSPPEDGVVVEVTGDDCFGEWYMLLKRSNYKQKPTNTKRFYREGKNFWRWVYADGLYAGLSVDEKDIPVGWRHSKDKDKDND